MYNDTVTLFNRQKTANGDVWYPTVLEGVNLNMDRGAIVRQYGEQAQDNAVLNVRYKENNSAKIISPSIIWQAPKEWQRLIYKSGYITFAPGDFFWAGEWPGTTPLSDDGYGDLSFYEYMTQNYDFVFNITSVGYFTVIPHFEVLGR